MECMNKEKICTILVASNANVGGPATAAAMANCRGWKELVQPAVLVGTLGYTISQQLDAWLVCVCSGPCNKGEGRVDALLLNRNSSTPKACKIYSYNFLIEALHFPLQKNTDIHCLLVEKEQGGDNVSLDSPYTVSGLITPYYPNWVCDSHEIQ
eukprot:Gb_16650 [translate_table: standard]